MIEVNMTKSQLGALKGFKDSGDYQGAYNHLASIVENTDDADTKISNWLTIASRINANDGSFCAQCDERSWF